MAYSQFSSLELNLLATQSVLPEKIILLVIDKEGLKQRLSLKNLDKIENQGTEKLLTIQQKLKTHAYALKEKFGCEVLELDAQKSVGDLHRQIMPLLNALFDLSEAFF